MTIPVNTISDLKKKFFDASIKVDSALMMAKAEEVSLCIIKLSDTFNEINEIINRTTSYWIGPGGDKYRSVYQKRKEAVEEILVRLKEHPQELRLMANNYEEVESRISEQNSQLKVDYI